MALVLAVADQAPCQEVRAVLLLRVLLREVAVQVRVLVRVRVAVRVQEPEPVRVLVPVPVLRTVRRALCPRSGRISDSRTPSPSVW